MKYSGFSKLTESGAVNTKLNISCASLDCVELIQERVWEEDLSIQRLFVEALIFTNVLENNIFNK